MQFQRLRLSGFKSFVEATEFRIEPGLTGIVGPNGCGKSNLLEGLRWVMGATSAKAMRGEGMEDVIFGGSTERPARNHAEVSLQIDNTDRTAPERFNDAAVIEVVRKIARGAGSSYRVNGAEARARDVQMLFADASTGANSPALVRQGQISELIAAKPSNRRRILEEAAGVSGLHSRRHEATLRLNAAEANLTRLDDLAGEIEATLNRLKREARRAEAYKRLSAQIRALQGAVALARWQAAADGLQAADTARTAAERTVAEAARALAEAEAMARTAAEARKPLHEEEMVAAAVRQRLELDRERLARETALAEAEAARLRADVARLTADQAREGEAAKEAAEALARTDRDLAELERAIAADPDREPALARALETAGAARAAADGEVERLAAEAAAMAAADAARRQAAQAALAQAQTQARAADGRRSEAAARVARMEAALAGDEREAAALQAPASPEAAAAGAASVQAQAELDAARAALSASETAQAEAAREEAAAREAARAADDRARRLKSEAQGLVQLAAAPTVAGAPSFAPALESVQAPVELAEALAAAFGDGLDAALDPAAAAFWAPPESRTVSPWNVRAAEAMTFEPAPLPDGAEPLGRRMQAPPALQAALAAVGLVERNEGAALRARLRPGQALVSREGDLWRWDGYTASAEAPRPLARRLAQRARLAELETALASLTPETAALDAAHRTAAERLHAASAAVAATRARLPSAERAAAAAREAVERHARAEAARAARAEALAEALARGRADLAEAGARLQAAEAEAAGAREDLTAAEAAAAPVREVAAPPATAALAEARRQAAAAREAEARSRAELDGERRAREGRARRRESLARDQGDWRRRVETAERRLQTLEIERQAAAKALRACANAPATMGQAAAALAAELTAAAARQAAAQQALQAGEARAASADQATRSAEQASAAAREDRAGALARLDAARGRLLDAAAQLRDASGGLTPDALKAELAASALATPPDPDGAEAHLHALERERDALGGVNLGAEDEAREQGRRLDGLRAERADLTDAIATLRRSIETLNAEGRERLLAAFEVIAASFRALFETLFEGGQAELRLAESEDPLEAGLEIYACPPGKRLAVMSLMSGGEQALTATALIFAVFLANPAPVCVLDEVDAPLDDANVDRFCRLLDEMRKRTDTRFIAITHNPVTMSRMDRLYGVTMAERGVSRLVSVDLRQAEALAAA